MIRRKPVITKWNLILTANNASKLLAKRAFDLSLVIVILLLMLPFFLLLLTLVLIEQLWRGHGVALFIYEPRLSHGNKFNLIKLNMFLEAARRSYVDTDDRYQKDGTYAYLQLDPASLSTTGRFIRKYYLDEAGQLINILRGEMSMVGPRPHPPSFESNSLPPRQQQKSGLVGFTATRWKNGKKVKPAEADMEYLLAYQNSSVLGLMMTDSMIIIDAIKAVFKGKGL